MTMDELNQLKKGDVVLDLDQTTRREKAVLCEVTVVEEDSVVVTSLQESDRGAYPHKFREHNAHQLTAVAIKGGIGALNVESLSMGSLKEMLEEEDKS